MNRTARQRAVHLLNELTRLKGLVALHLPNDKTAKQHIIQQARKSARLAVSRVAASNPVHWPINERAKLEPDVRDCQTADGYIWCQSGGRDCDMCESTSRPYKMRASLMEWQRHINNLYEWAEGAVWFWLVHEDKLSDCEHGFRDLAFEAHEDGHDHIVSRVRFESN